MLAVWSAAWRRIVNVRVQWQELRALLDEVNLSLEQTIASVDDTLAYCRESDARMNTPLMRGCRELS